MQLVIFDFCETLVNFQTADSFVDFIIKKENYTKFRWVNILNKILTKTRFLAVLNKFSPELNPSKRLKLFQIRGLAEAKVNQYAIDFYNEKIMSNRIMPLYEKMQKHIENKDFVIIISGGYTPYLKVFSEKHNIQAFFGTEVETRDSKLTGLFSGKDCLHGQKIDLLEKYIKENQINFTNSISYSDSITDLPLLKWTDEAFVISKNKSQSWVKSYGFKEIIH